MTRMDSYDAVMLEHRLRSQHADRIGWLMQAASTPSAAPRRRGGDAARPLGIAALLAGLLTALFR